MLLIGEVDASLSGWVVSRLARPPPSPLYLPPTQVAGCYKVVCDTPILSVKAQGKALYMCVWQHFGSPVEFLPHTKASFPPLNCEVQQFIFTRA